MHNTLSIHRVTTIDVTFYTRNKLIDSASKEEYSYELVKIDIIDSEGKTIEIDLYGEHNKNVQLQAKNK